jgi:hypothetical protein
MSLCVLCAQPTLGPGNIYDYHMYAHGDDWAAANRIMCDFLHRGVVPPAPCERDDSPEFLGEPLAEPVSP